LRAVFLTWTDHRRSRTLAPAFGAEYVALQSNLPYLLRAIVLGARTLMILISRRPQRVICQNPSLVLTWVCCVSRPILGYELVVDRHSNFKLESRDSSELKLRLFHVVSRWTVRKADLTIVTNANLKKVVDDWGGVGFVLPDKMPAMVTSIVWPDGHERQLVAVFVASFDTDEPLAEVLEAARELKQQFHFYVTGNYRRAGIKPDPADTNVTFTGFLSDDQYVALLRRADVVVVLTNEEDLLNCGSYEAVALGRPMLLSATKAIREYFNEGAIYCDNSTSGILAGLRELARERVNLAAGVARLRSRLERDWQSRFDELQRRAPPGRAGGL
jgi:glycosyltransferase involved in cell wall biosynthesis